MGELLRMQEMMQAHSHMFDLCHRMAQEAELQRAGRVLVLVAGAAESISAS